MVVQYVDWRGLNMEDIIGYWTVSNFGGISVVKMDGDSMTVRWYDDKETTTHEIVYELTEDGEYEPCINYNNTLYWLSDCMRVKF
jgi:hypothetical protein